MADGAAIGPDVGLSHEVLQGGEGVTLYKSSRFDVFVPKKPNIPLNEGLHVQVSDGHDASNSAKEVLARYLMAEGAAKVIAESDKTPDAWANTRLEEGQVVNVYGRIAEVEDSWRKAANALDRNVPEIDSLDSNYDAQKLQRLCASYLPKWEQLANSIELFKDGVNGKDIDDFSKDAATIWENDKIKLEVILNPHLKGMHLIASPKDGFRRQWQTIKGQSSEQIYIQQTLEAIAVAMGVQKLLAGGKGEIHNSGNWASGLKSTKEGGKLDLEKLAKNSKVEKRSHRPDIAKPENQINTGMHVHVYIPSEGPVILPEMSKEEAIEKGKEDVVKQWEEIPPTSSAQLEEIRIKLSGGKLTKWLEDNCKGQLKSKTT